MRSYGSSRRAATGVRVLMVRYLRAPRFAALLAPVAGLICFVWEARDLGESCGYREGSGLPSFPSRIAWVVLVCVPVLVTVGRALGERRTPRAVLALAALAAVLAGAAVGAAELAFFLSRHCYA
jgi:hypothetical protein